MLGLLTLPRDQLLSIGKHSQHRIFTNFLGIEYGGLIGGEKIDRQGVGGPGFEFEFRRYFIQSEVDMPDRH